MSVRLVLSGLALVGVMGCDAVTDRIAAFPNVAAGSNETSEGIRTLAMLGGDVRVRCPEGYCIDQGASDARRGFAVLVGCALLTDEGAIMPNLDGLITVQFADEGTASVTDNEDAFASFLESDAGRGVLAGNGDLVSVGAVSTITDRAGVLARFEDTSGPSFTGTSGLQWRGFLDVGDRLATISVLSFDRKALSRGQGERLLIVAMAELAEINTQDVVVAQAPSE